MISSENHDSYFLPLEPNKAVALTMNFPQHDPSISKMMTPGNNQTTDQLSNEHHSHGNHITTDPHGCLECMSTMYGPNYAPFAAFSIFIVFHFLFYEIYLVNEFSEFAQTQKTIAMKQNDLIESFLSYHQQQHPKKHPINEQELQHVFTYGTWSNGKVN
jgi:hypothetical protein